MRTIQRPCSRGTDITENEINPLLPGNATITTDGFLSHEDKVIYDNYSIDISSHETRITDLETLPGGGHGIFPGELTLTPNQGSTTVNDTNTKTTSKIFLFPTSAGAATDFTLGVYLSAKIEDIGFTVTHPNNATTGKTCDYTIIN